MHYDDSRELNQAFNYNVCVVNYISVIFIVLLLII